MIVLTGRGRSRQRGARWQLSSSSNHPGSRRCSIIRARNRSACTRKLTWLQLIVDQSSLDHRRYGRWLLLLLLFFFSFFLSFFFHFLRWRCFSKPSFARVPSVVRLLRNHGVLFLGRCTGPLSLSISPGTSGEMSFRSAVSLREWPPIPVRVRASYVSSLHDTLIAFSVAKTETRNSSRLQFLG